jgi:hypothetical protein
MAAGQGRDRQRNLNRGERVDWLVGRPYKANWLTSALDRVAAVWNETGAVVVGAIVSRSPTHGNWLSGSRKLNVAYRQFNDIVALWQQYAVPAFDGIVAGATNVWNWLVGQPYEESC